MVPVGDGSAEATPALAGTARTIPAPDLVVIRAGTLRMGSTPAEVDACVAYWGPRLVDASYDVDAFRDWIRKEAPKHTVRLRAFAIGRFPVTNEQYRAFVLDTGAGVPESLDAGEPDDHPVWGVSYEDAERFSEWLGAATGRRFRLPTEAEWEYAARADTDHEYPWGDEFDPGRCNTLESAIGSTTPVDRYPSGASPFGVMDLGGNVEEWTSDRYSPYPGGETIADDITRTAGPRYRILRGGSFARGGDLARCARRHGPHPAAPFRHRGFRVVAEVPG